MGRTITLNGHNLDLETIERIATGNAKVAIAREARLPIRKGRAIVERYLKKGIPAYGLNTGLGIRVMEKLPEKVLAEFSYRMIRGRAQGVGSPLNPEEARAIMAVRLNTMLTGVTGQSEGLADYLALMINRRIAPVVPRIASIGASDLVAMAALARVLIGEGEVFFQGKRMTAEKAFKLAGLAPLKLGPKDGHILCNITSFSVGRAALAARRARRSVLSQVVAGGLTLEGFRANKTPFEENVLKLRAQQGAEKVGRDLRFLLEGGELLREGSARRLQDPLSIRCMAQVCGSAYEQLEHMEDTVNAELNAAADNPAVLIGEGRIVTTGNFHQSQLTAAADGLARSLAWTATDGASRVARLLSPGFSGLPALLSSDAPERAGFGPVMKTAEALRGEIVHLSTPVPVMASHNADGQEDSLSHSPLAVQKLNDLLDRLDLLTAVELVAAAQAIDLASSGKVAPRLSKVKRAIRKLSALIQEDRPLGAEFESIAKKLVGTGMLARIAGLQA